jgi:tetratricopeptide (TPR) repeat protein
MDAQPAAGTVRRGEQVTVRKALTLARALNYPVSEGFALDSLGRIYSELGQFDDALELFQQALAVRRQADDRHGAATTLVELGNLFHDAGRHEVALQSWRQALTIYDDLGAPETARLRHQLEARGASVD